MDQIPTPNIESLPPVNPPTTESLPAAPRSSFSTKNIKIIVTIYAVCVACILFGENVPGTIGNLVNFLSALPMFIAGSFLGMFILGYGISISLKKENRMVVRILSPFVGVTAGFIVFVFGAFMTLGAIFSNVSAGGC